MEVRWMTRVNDDGEEVKFYPVTHINAIVDDNEVPMPELINGLKDEVENHTHSEIVNAVTEVKNDLENLTASDVGAVPIIDAKSASYDMDAILKGGAHQAIYITNSATLGTPKNKGASTYGDAIIFSYSVSTNYGSQFAFLTGGVESQFMMWRTLRGGTVSDWTTGYLPLTGGTLSDALRMKQGAYSELFIFSANSAVSGGHHYVDINLTGETNMVGIRMQAEANGKANPNIKFSIQPTGGTKTQYNLYGEHNITAGTTALTAGTSALTTGCIYQKYE